MTQICSLAQSKRAATLAQLGHAFRAMLPTLALVGVIWSVSSWGYYALVDAMALDSGYEEAPFTFAGYYLAWTGVVLLTFRPDFKRQLSRPILSGHVIALAPILMAYGVFVALALPLLPDVSVFRAPPNSAGIHVCQRLVLPAQIVRYLVPAGYRRGHGPARAPRPHATLGDLDHDGGSLWRLPRDLGL